MQPINPDVAVLGTLDGKMYGVIHGVFRNGEGGTWFYVCDLADWRDHPDHVAIIEAREREISDLQARIAELNAAAERTRAVMARWMREGAPPDVLPFEPEPTPEPEPEPQPETFACDQCGKTFASKKSLQGHIYGKHRQSAAPSYACECGQVFATEVGLARHRSSVHSQTFATTSPYSAAAVAAALATPENEHEFQCAQCGSQGPESLKRRGICVRCSKAQDGLVAA